MDLSELLPSLPSLQRLWVDTAVMGMKSVAPLPALTALKALRLDGLIDPSVYHMVAACKQLTWLRLGWHSYPTIEDYASLLQQLPNLVSADFNAPSSLT